MFFIYYGLTYFIASWGFDAFEYARRFQVNATLPFSDFFKIVGGLYSDTSVDIVEPFISFVISRFTSYHGFLFAAYAALFGFFYLKSINLLYNRYLEKPDWNTKIFMFFFVVIIPITSINNFRMWTATWIFFFGAYYVILFRDARYFVITLGACLVHWSFLMLNGVLLIYYLIGNRNYIYLPITIASFILPDSLISVFSSMSLMFGESIGSRYSSYTNEEYATQYQESWQHANWYLPLSKDLVFYYLIFAIVIIYIFYRKLMSEKSEKNLFSFLLLFLSFVNFGESLPNFAYRFKIIFLLFATCYLFHFILKLPGNKLNLFTLAGLFPIALFTVVELRLASDYINVWILLPGFGTPFFVQGITLSEIILPH